jgi:hypothetical protein
LEPLRVDRPTPGASGNPQWIIPKPLRKIRVPGHVPEVQALGEPFGEFRGLEVARLVIVVFLIWSSVAPILMMFPIVLDPHSPELPTLVACHLVLVTPLAIVYGLLYFQAARTRVVVCANGILTFQGGVRSHRWEDIVAVYQGRRTTYLGPGLQSGTRRLVVVSRTGGTFVFDGSYERFSELARWIHWEVTRVLFPGALEDYRAGRKIEFECVTVSEAGLRFQGELIPWSKIRKVSIRRDEITFHDNDRSDPLLTLPLGRIANPLLLADLLHLVVGPTENLLVRGQFLYLSSKDR